MFALNYAQCDNLRNDFLFLQGFGTSRTGPSSILLKTDSIAQSLCTHYSSLSGRPDISLGSGTLKKSGPKYEPEKSREQKTGTLLFKKEEAAWPLLFLNQNDPVFSPCFIQVHVLDLIFFRATNCNQ